MIFLELLGFIFFKLYGEFVEFSLRFTAAVSAVAVCQRECGSAHYTKIGDAGVRRRGLWTSLALLTWVAAQVER